MPDLARLPLLDSLRAAARREEEHRYAFVPDAELDELRAAIEHATTTGDRAAWERLERRAALRVKHRIGSSCEWEAERCPVPGGCVTALLDSVQFEEHLGLLDERRGISSPRMDFTFWALRLHRGEIRVGELPVALEAWREAKDEQARERARQAAAQVSPEAAASEPAPADAAAVPAAGGWSDVGRLDRAVLERLGLGPRPGEPAPARPKRSPSGKSLPRFGSTSKRSRQWWERSRDRFPEW